MSPKEPVRVSISRELYPTVKIVTVMERLTIEVEAEAEAEVAAVLQVVVAPAVNHRGREHRGQPRCVQPR